MTHLKSLLSYLAFSTALVACGEVATSPSGDPGPDAAPGATPDGSVETPGNLELSADLTKVPLLQGTTATLSVRVTRHDGASGPVEVTLASLPAGVTASPLTIEAGETSGELAITAAATAPHSLPTTVAIRGVMGDATSSASITVTVTGAPGALDTSFGGGKVRLPAGAGDDYLTAAVVQPDGKVILAGSAAEHVGDFALLRLDHDGNLDPSFGNGGRVLTDFAGSSEGICAVALQPDGKIVAAGYSTVSGSSLDFALARYNSDGTLDTGFGTGGKVTTAIGTDIDTAYAILVASDGAIIAGGNSNRGFYQSTGLDFALARYTPSGQLDPTFGTNGIALTSIRAGSAGDSIYALAFQSFGAEQRIVAAGGDGDFTIARYRATGVLDTTFGTNGITTAPFGSTSGAARSLALTSSGSIVLAGRADTDVALLRLTAAGAIDTSFGNQGKVITPVSTTNTDEARALAIDSDGKLVVAGWVAEANTSAGNFAVLRYQATGQLDPSFGGTGIVITAVAPGSKPDEGRAVAIQHDDRVPADRIIAAGTATDTNYDFAVTRFWR